MASKPGTIGELKQLWANMKNPDVAAWKKVAVGVAAGAYVLSPIDIIPDFIPGLGQIDDIAVAYWLSKGFNKLAEQDIAKAQEQKMELQGPEATQENIYSRLDKLPKGNNSGPDIEYAK